MRRWHSFVLALLAQECHAFGTVFHMVQLNVQLALSESLPGQFGLAFAIFNQKDMGQLNGHVTDLQKDGSLATFGV